MKLSQINPNTILYGAIGCVVIYVAYKIATKKPADLGNDVGKGLVDLVDGVVGGVVKGVGGVVGIPDTDEQLCIIAKRNGDHWAASKYCTASDFMSWELHGAQSGGASGDW